MILYRLIYRVAEYFRGYLAASCRVQLEITLWCGRRCVRGVEAAWRLRRVLVGRDDRDGCYRVQSRFVLCG